MHLATRPQQQNHSAKPGRCCFLPSSSLSSTVSTSPAPRTAAAQASALTYRTQHLQVASRRHLELARQVAGRTARGMGCRDFVISRARPVEISSCLPAWQLGMGAGTSKAAQQWQGAGGIWPDVWRKLLITHTCARITYRVASSTASQHQTQHAQRKANGHTPHGASWRSHATHRLSEQRRTP